MNFKHFVRIETQKLSSTDLNRVYISEIAKLLCVSPLYIKIEKDPDGMPFGSVKDQKIFLSFSHSENLVAGCVSNSHHVGIDIQKIRPVNFKVLNKICTQDELSQIEITEDNFFRIWTIKEAALKCTGLGFQYSAQKLKINFQNQTVTALDPVNKIGWSAHSILNFTEIKTQSDFHLAVVTKVI